MVLDAKDKTRYNLIGVIYLGDSSTCIKISNDRRLNIYGSPWTHFVVSGISLSNRKDTWTGPVPMVIDVLVTYMLPLFHLDIADFGDENLLEEMGRTRSRLHVFRHIHEGYGKGYFVYCCFEACYEDICRGIGSLSILVELMYFSSIQSSWGSRAVKGPDLINTVATVGLRNTEGRRPLVIQW